MSANAQKTPLARTLNRFAEQKVSDALQLLGKALPCSVTAVNGSIVTVKFEVNSAPYTLPQITVPMFGPEYIRYPTQVGDKGIVIPADAYLGGVSGLGGGIADLSVPANLSSLIFLPIASTHWSPSEDPNSLVLYGPNGVIIRDANKQSTIALTAGGITITLQPGDAVTLIGNLIETGNITLTGNINETGTVTLIGDINETGNINQIGNINQTGNITQTGNINQTGNTDTSGHVIAAGLVRGGTIQVDSTVALTRILIGSTTFAPSAAAFGGINATIAVAGAKPGDSVIVNTNGLQSGFFTCYGYVSSANTVTLNFRNTNASAFTDVATVYSVMVIGTTP